VLKTVTKVKTQALRAGGQPALYINIVEPDLDKTSLASRQAANSFYFLPYTRLLLKPQLVTTVPATDS
jgi:hypothetical protein